MPNPAGETAESESKANESNDRINKGLVENGSKGALDAFHIELNSGNWSQPGSDTGKLNVTGFSNAETFLPALALTAGGSGSRNLTVEDVKALEATSTDDATKALLQRVVDDPKLFQQLADESWDNLMPDFLGGTEKTITPADLTAAVARGETFRYATILSANSNELLNTIAPDGRLTLGALEAYKQKFGQYGEPAATGPYSSENMVAVNEMISAWNTPSMANMKTWDYFKLDKFITPESMEKAVGMPLGSVSQLEPQSENNLVSHVVETLDGVKEDHPILAGPIDLWKAATTSIMESPVVQFVNDMPGKIKGALDYVLPDQAMDIVDQFIPDTSLDPVDDILYPESPAEFWRGVNTALPLPLATKIATGAVIAESASAEAASAEAASAEAADESSTSQTGSEAAGEETASASAANADTTKDGESKIVNDEFVVADSNVIAYPDGRQVTVERNNDEDVIGLVMPTQSADPSPPGVTTVRYALRETPEGNSVWTVDGKAEPNIDSVNVDDKNTITMIMNDGTIAQTFGDGTTRVTLPPDKLAEQETAEAEKAAEADQAAADAALAKQREAVYMQSVAALVTPGSGEGYSQVACRMLGIPVGSDLVANVSTDPTEAKAQWDAIFKLSDSLAALNGNKIDWNSNTWGDPIPQNLGSFLSEENLANLEKDNPGISKTLDALADQAMLDHKLYIPIVTQN